MRWWLNEGRVTRDDATKVEIGKKLVASVGNVMEDIEKFSAEISEWTSGTCPGRITAMINIVAETENVNTKNYDINKKTEGPLALKKKKIKLGANLVPPIRLNLMR